MIFFYYFRNQHPNTIFFFLKTLKAIFKNCSQKMFFRSIFENTFQTGPWLPYPKLPTVCVRRNKVESLGRRSWVYEIPEDIDLILQN